MERTRTTAASAVLLTTLCMACLAPAIARGTPGAEPLPDTLVSPGWLSAHLEDPDLIVVDCTVSVARMPDGALEISSGRPGYEAGHIPGATFADLPGELSDPDGPFAYTLPSPEAFARSMEALGVGDDRRVVLYDRNYTAWAARVWWMLRWIGFDRVAILDGGLGAWTAAGLPVGTGTPSPRPGQLTVSLRPEIFVGQDEVHLALGREDTRLVDAMPEAHYRGDLALYGRPGHIPGATNVSALALLDEQGRYRPAGELSSLLGEDRGTRAITYCGGGIAASSVAFALLRAGHEHVAVYAASLEEWAADPANPLVTGPDPRVPRP